VVVSDVVRPSTTKIVVTRVYEDEKQIVFVEGKQTCYTESNDLDRSVLNKRAWVFQERMLSPCTLHFGRDNMHWDCRKGIECNPSPEDVLHSKLRPKSMYLTLNELNADKSEESLQSFQENWREILKHYCDTRLSHEEDRLSAIRGIVSVPQKKLGMQASFGLWLDLLVHELCWYADSFPEGTLSNFVYVPTWSWLHLTYFKLLYMDNSDLYNCTWIKTFYKAKVTANPTPTPFIQTPQLSGYPGVLRISSRCVGCIAIQQTKNSIETWTISPVLKEQVIDSTNSKDNVQELLDHDKRFYPDIRSIAVEHQVLHCLLLQRQAWTEIFGSWNLQRLHVRDLCLVLRQAEEDHLTRVGVYREDISVRRSSVLKTELWNKDAYERLENNLLMFPGEDGEEKEISIR
jgi:hypothetical protein